MKFNTKQVAFIGFISVLVTLTSCRSNQELVYLRDVNSNENIAGVPKAMPLYKIHKKDNLYVSIVTSNPELNKVYNPIQAGNGTETNKFENQAVQFINGYEVDTDGTIALPIIGKVNVEGKSIADSQKEIQARALVYLKDAAIKVKLLNFRITVLGEVKVPGVYFNYNNNFNVLDAIGVASGNTDYADLTNVMVLRPTLDGSQTFKLNLNNKASLSSEGYLLQPNDAVFVQPAKNKFYQVHTSTAAVILTSISSVLLLLNYIKK